MELFDIELHYSGFSKDACTIIDSSHNYLSISYSTPLDSQGDLTLTFKKNNNVIKIKTYSFVYGDNTDLLINIKGFYKGYYYIVVTNLDNTHLFLKYDFTEEGEVETIYNDMSVNIFSGILGKYLSTSAHLLDLDSNEEIQINATSNYFILYFSDDYLLALKDIQTFVKVSYSLSGGILNINENDIKYSYNLVPIIQEFGQLIGIQGYVENDTLIVWIAEFEGHYVDLYYDKNSVLYYQEDKQLLYTILSLFYPISCCNNFLFVFQNVGDNENQFVQVNLKSTATTSFTVTINFADGDSVARELDREVYYVETHYLVGTCTFNFYDKENKIILSTAHDNPDSYKYAETITINGNQYPINTKQQITLNSDFTIQVNNGVVAYYYVAFNNDTKILQQERLQENTLPVYKGETPTKAGYEFIGWEPDIVPVTATATYNAKFGLKPFTITIEDEGGSSALEVTWYGSFGDGEFNEAITKIDSVLYEPFGFANMSFTTPSGKSGAVFVKYNNGLIPVAFIIGETTYDFKKEYEVNITSDTTIKIRGNSKYSIRFLNYDNTILESTDVWGGVTPTYTGDTPYRKGYTFTGRNPTLYPANKDQDYVANFEINTFTIRFLDDDGTVLETKTFDYGVIPTYSEGTPVKEGYVFNGWSPVPYPADKDQDYKATYRTTTFLITLYKNTAENNRIDKTEYLTKVIDLQGYFRQETNIINPSIIIEYAGDINFNYVYISTFNRYYFVNSITSVRTNLWRLEMSCDVLMTYKETILNYSCYVSRNENEYNEDIEDTYLPLEYEKVVEITNLYDERETFDAGKIFLKGDYSVVCTTIYTGESFEVTEAEMSTAFQDKDGTRLTVSNISLGASNYRCSGIIKNNILKVLNSLVAKTIEDDKLASYIISLIAFPVSGNEISITQVKDVKKLLLKDDTTSITVEQGDVVYPSSGTLTPFVVNDFTILPKYNNFLDYEPYTTYEIYLPFYGWLKLNSYQILNEHLIVTYIPQVDSEQCSIIIGKGDIVNGTKEVIAEVTCQLGIQIPVNSTNLGQINREKGASILNSAVGSLSGIAMAGVGVATGNPLMVTAGAMTTIGSVTSGISKDMTMQPEAQSKTGSSYDGALGDRIFKLRVTYPKIAVDNLTTYAKFIGRPLQKNVLLSSLTGYTVVGGVHIENLGTATDTEKTDIENKLRKGVII